MKRRLITFAIVVPVALSLCAATGWAQSADSTIVAWGWNSYGQCDVPSPNRGFVAITAGYHSMGLRSNGSITAWGQNSSGQCDVPLPNEGFVAIAGDAWHSLGLRSDGSITAWGDNAVGQCNVPPPNEGFTSIAVGAYHSLGLKLNGTIVAWGWNAHGQCAVPLPNDGFIAVEAGDVHSIGLRSGGAIAAWGENNYGQCDVPVPNAGFIAVAAGSYHSLGLKSDGTVVAWGDDRAGRCNIPSPNEGFVAIAAGGWYSLALKFDGSIVAWGQNTAGQCDVPSPNSGFVAIAAGAAHSLGLRMTAECTVDMAIGCPDDQYISAYSHIESMSLVGFHITNVAPIPLSFDYSVVGEGPLTLGDKGDPSALVGTTPTLFPGQTYYPPEAELIVPTIRETPPTRRFSQTVIYDPVGERMLLFGGGYMGEGQQFLNDLWELSLSGFLEWAPLPAFGVPPGARLGHTAVYDPVDHRMIVFGGFDEHSTTNDVWALSLEGEPEWTQLAPVGAAPAPRAYHNAVYDPVGERMLVFGGYGGSGNDVWSLSLGSSPQWTQLAPSGTPPSARQSASAIYDPAAHRMIVFGGVGDGGWPSSIKDDLFALSLDPIPQWTQLIPGGTTPAGRTNHTAIYDPVRSQMVILAGTFGRGHDYDDVWALPLTEGAQWMELAPPGDSPGARYSHSAMYDPVGDRMLTFGGFRCNDLLTPKCLCNDLHALSLGVNPRWTGFAPPEYAKEYVRYSVAITGTATCEELGTTVVTIEPPVPVLIAGFRAIPSGNAVDLSWDIVSDEEVSGFEIYRNVGDTDIGEDLTPGGVISPRARTYRDGNVSHGTTYQYTLVVTMPDGSGVRSQTIPVTVQASAFALGRSRPNPFNPSTRITFMLDENAPASLSVFDVSGRLVITLVNGYRKAGTYTVEWDGRDGDGNGVASGVYFFKLTAGSRVLTRKAVLLK